MTGGILCSGDPIATPRTITRADRATPAANLMLRIRVLSPCRHGASSETIWTGTG